MSYLGKVGAFIPEDGVILYQQTPNVKQVAVIIQDKMRLFPIDSQIQIYCRRGSLPPLYADLDIPFLFSVIILISIIIRQFSGRNKQLKKRIVKSKLLLLTNGNDEDKLSMEGSRDNPVNISSSGSEETYFEDDRFLGT